MFQLETDPCNDVEHNSHTVIITPLEAVVFTPSRDIGPSADLGTVRPS